MSQDLETETIQIRKIETIEIRNNSPRDLLTQPASSAKVNSHAKRFYFRGRELVTTKGGA